MPSSTSVGFPSSKYRTKGGHYYIPVQIWNKKQKKALTFEMEVDTGADYSYIGSDIAEKLDIDIESGVGPHKFSETSIGSYEGHAYEYHHYLDIRLGSLPWLKQEFVVVDQPIYDTLGWKGILDKYRLKFSTTGLVIEKYITDVVKFRKGTIEGYIFVSNVENGKEIKIPMTIDTGATHTTIDNKYMRLLGINETTKKTLQSISYMAPAANWLSDINKKLPEFKKTGYYLQTKLGQNLKPIMLPIWFDDLKDWNGVGMLGIGFIMSKDKYNITFEKDRVIYEETFYGTAGVSNSGRNYRNRYI